MKITCNRSELLNAFSRVASMVPSRSPKLILQNVKLTVNGDGNAVLMGTDLEVGIRNQVSGVHVENPGDVILPTIQISSILRTSVDDEIELAVDGDKLIVRTAYAEFRLPTEDADLFPDVPDFTAESYHVILAGDLRKLIQRTIFATDQQSARYAMGGTLVEFEPVTLAVSTIGMVGTDGRRLARMVARAWIEGEPEPPFGTPVIPVKALKLIERNLTDEDDLVHLAINSNLATVRTSYAIISTRLVDGRFPRYQDVFPSSALVRIPLDAVSLRSAVEQASIVTSDESRGVDFQFSAGLLKLSSQAADVGSSHVDLPITYDGKPIAITFDPRYLIDALKTLDETSAITAELIDAKNAAVFRTADQYTYVVMPLTRD